MHMPSLRNLLLRCVSLSGLILATAPAGAQVLRVTAANASNSAVYDVTFVGSGGYITTLNTDQNTHVSFRSLVFIPNTATGKIDLLIADASRGEIDRYADAAGASTTVWSTAMGAGPTYPDGLSVDAAGNLYVVTSAPGNPKPAQVWVLPRDPGQPAGAAFLAPRLIDENFGGVSVQGLEDSVISATSSNAARPGDLLVLASSPASVFVYSAANIRSVLSGGGPVSPSRTLIGPAQFPAGASPGGMDFWPLDSSLLITTSSGTILRYTFTATTTTRLADFSSGLGNGKFKIRTGLENGVAYAFVANNNGGNILKFGAPALAGGPNPPLATVTSDVQHPQGIAASNLAAVGANSCLQSAGGCDVLGTVISHSVQGVQTLGSNGYVIESPCVVQIDPRIAQYGTCTGHSLPVAQVCAGYGTTVIPAYLCGGSGASGSGFALVRSYTNTLGSAKGALVLSEVVTEDVLPGSSPPCPQTVVGWAPTEGEGTIVEGSGMLEATGGCGSSKSLTKGLSLWAVGLVLNEAALPGTSLADKRVEFATSKYDALSSTIALATITSTFRTTLSSCLAKSRDYFKKKKYINAAAQLITCDALVAASEAAFTASASSPNPSGEIRGRIANLYLQINTRILGNPAPTTWPLLP